MKIVQKIVNGGAVLVILLGKGTGLLNVGVMVMG